MYQVKKTDDYILGDYVLSITVILQYFLSTLQQCMISVLHMNPESTTVYRIFLSAIPILFSFYYLLKREARTVISVYFFTLLIVFFQSVIFPDNFIYINKQAFRFLIPVCLPCLLSLFSIRNFYILQKVLRVISWMTFALLLIYVVSYFLNVFYIDKYNMAFGYGLLLPTLILYTEKNLISFCAFLFSVFSILSFASRGPLVVVFLYIFYDLYKNNKKYLPMLIGLVFFILASLSYIVSYLETIGIHSRTLSMIVNGNIDSDSGRERLYDIILNGIFENPLMGLGIFSDRVLLEGIQPYCHNFLLELLIDWGIPLSILIILILFVLTIKAYLYSNNQEKAVLVMFLLSSLIPLQVSGSYINDSSFFSFIGLLLFLQKRRRYQEK